MKRVLSTLLSASLAAGSITASLPEVFADDYVCDFTEEQIEASEVKPEIFLTIDVEKYGKVFDAEEMAGKTVICSINVSGAEDKYCTTQFHIYYAQRLKIIDKDERELCTKGSAIDNLYKLINQRDFTHDILVNEPTRTPYEQSNSAINRRFCYNESKSYSSIWRVALFL